MDSVKKYLAEIGARGGRSKTQAKSEASRKNLELARKMRSAKFANQKNVIDNK